jgi:2,3-bisphosphoglycerate-independent phosphoglycerate mutase
MPQYAKEDSNKSTLLSWFPDGVHSHTSHLRGLIDAARIRIKEVFVHAFTTRRTDVDQEIGKNYIQI